ncbi:MAG: NAD(P)/FAD-dependent oxidoreductase [Spirochaetota bacterium]
MVHILGGGIAGLLLAGELERRNVPWHVWEKASQPGAEASGKNAGIIRSYEADPVISKLARASVEYYRKHEPSYDPCGIAFAPWEFDYLAPEYPKTRLLSGKEGILLTDDGCVEPMEVLQRLAGAHYHHGKISYSVAAQVEIAGSKVAWRFGDAVPAAGDSIVIACGEGAIAFDKALRRGLTLVPHLRTLYEYENMQGYRGPVQWDEESGSYFRVSGDTITATAGEQIPVPPRTEGASDDRQADEQSPAVLARQFPFLQPAQLRSWRTCRRLMPLDNRPYCGRDTQIGNLYWLTGLGGRGMSIAPALAILLAGLIARGESDEVLDALSPARVGQ